MICLKKTGYAIIKLISSHDIIHCNDSHLLNGRTLEQCPNFFTDESILEPVSLNNNLTGGYIPLNEVPRMSPLNQ